MSDELTWGEWSSLPSGKDRHRERLEKEERDRRLNAEARADHRRELIDKKLVCNAYINGKLCCDCKKPKNCLNDTDWMRTKRDRSPCQKYDCSKCPEERICRPEIIESKEKRVEGKPQQ